MIIKVGDKFIDTTTTPFALAFSTKEEAEIVGNIISNIEKGDSDSPNEYSWFIRSPQSMSRKEIDDWANLTGNEKIVDCIVSSEIKNKL